MKDDEKRVAQLEKQMRKIHREHLGDNHKDRREERAGRLAVITREYLEIIPAVLDRIR